MLFSSKAYRAAEERGDLSEASCARCGRDTDKSFFVEFHDGVANLGFFPVGPECFSQLKKAGYTVLPASEVAS